MNINPNVPVDIPGAAWQLIPFVGTADLSCRESDVSVGSSSIYCWPVCCSCVTGQTHCAGAAPQAIPNTIPNPTLPFMKPNAAPDATPGPAPVPILDPINRAFVFSSDINSSFLWRRTLPWSESRMDSVRTYGIGVGKTVSATYSIFPALLDGGDCCMPVRTSCATQTNSQEGKRKKCPVAVLAGCGAADIHQAQ